MSIEKQQRTAGNKKNREPRRLFFDASLSKTQGFPRTRAVPSLIIYWKNSKNSKHRKWVRACRATLTGGADMCSLGLQHRAEDAVGRAVAVGKGLDVDDHPLAHCEPSFDRRRAHMRQQHDIVERP